MDKTAANFILQYYIGNSYFSFFRSNSPSSKFDSSYSVPNSSDAKIKWIIYKLFEIWDIYLCIWRVWKYEFAVIILEISILLLETTFFNIFHSEIIHSNTDILSMRYQSIVCYALLYDRKSDSHPFLELPIRLDCSPLSHFQSPLNGRDDPFIQPSRHEHIQIKKESSILKWGGGGGEANEMKQYQNQDFWVGLNDKHIDEIEFTCTPKSERNVPIRRNSLHIAISAKGLRRIENNKHTLLQQKAILCAMGNKFWIYLIVWQ